MKSVLITGGNSGIGKATCLALAAKGYQVVFVSRNREKAEAVKSEIVSSTGNENAGYIIADLSSVKSVRECANTYKLTYHMLDILINNAGVCLPEKRITIDGFEESFQINHLAPFILSNLLLDILRKSGDSRIINVSSGAHKSGKFDPENMQSGKNFNRFGTYADTKLLNILFTIELAKRVKDLGITVNSLHPGVVNTNFAGEFKGFLGFLSKLVKPLFLSPEKGAATSVYLASSDKLRNITGKYFVNCKPVETKNEYITPENCSILWNKSLILSGL